jgi:hypothetical protein
MPIFEVEANGKRYEVDAPSAAAAIEALSGVDARTASGMFDDLIPQTIRRRIIR